MEAVGTRQGQLLRLLAASGEPVPVLELGERLRVSRRTVFRELGEIDQVLEPYGLHLATATGRGLFLAGEAADKARLLADLGSAGDGPADRYERLPRLALLLLEEGEATAEPLAWYAARLKVSEATVSHDLAQLDAHVARYGLQVVRRQGRGVYSAGSEQARRRALAWAWRELESLGVGRRPRVGHTPGFLDEVRWMTPESLDALDLYLALAAHRIEGGHAVEPAPADQAYLPAARRLAAIVAEPGGPAQPERTDPWPEPEIAALSVFLSACRHVREDTVAGPVPFERQALVFRLIEAFDPGAAPLLKLDEDLVTGLTLHVASALVRLDQAIDLDDPLAEQLAATYPGVLSRAARAARLLARPGRTVPDAEISFLAAHFGAALHRLQERGLNRRRVRVGVVCLAGIGSSYLLAAQLKSRFGREADIEVADPGTSGTGFDLIVSTVPLPDCPRPVVEVAAVLDQADADRVAAAVAQAARTARREDASVKPSHPGFIDALAGLATDAQGLVRGFTAVEADDDCTIDRLARLAGYRFGEDAASGKAIYTDLMAREHLSSQVIPELGVVLLHARTEGVDAPVFALLLPRSPAFTQPELKGARAAVVMLIPPAANPDRTALMGALSAALIQSEPFLADIAAHRPAQVLGDVTAHLETFLVDFTHRLKG
ncbi:MAG: PRD domain-containing protein [Propionibacteriaceae bacterium]|jgi:mannitol operon transcriptional antiterminator|nr:PRD domain-containing protein [Propionibacteriaceae bacterium]